MRVSNGWLSVKFGLMQDHETTRVSELKVNTLVGVNRIVPKKLGYG